MNKESGSFKMGLNKFADLSDQEFEAKFLGYASRDDRPEGTEVIVKGANPTHVDHTTEAGVNPIKN